MNYRLFPGTDLEVSEIGYGCSRLGKSFFEDNSEVSLPILEKAFELGVNLYDTSPTYGYGSSESIVGKFVKQKRDKIFLSTKGGFKDSSLARIAKPLLPFAAPFRGVLKSRKKNLKKVSSKRSDFTVPYLEKTFEESLVRLRTETIDFYQLHNPPQQTLQEEEVFEWLKKIKKEGKIRYYGISLSDPDDTFLIDDPEVSFYQVTFNLLELKARETLFDYCIENNKGLFIKTPLARGLLTKAKQAGTVGVGMNGSPNLPINAIESISALKQNGELSALKALRFILDHPSVSSVLVGTLSESHLLRNCMASGAPSFTKSEFQKIIRTLAL